MPWYGSQPANYTGFSPYGVTSGKDPNEVVSGSGLQRWQHEMLARNLGFGGEFGAGAHNEWLQGDPSRQSAWQRGVTELTDSDPNTNFGGADWLYGEAAPGVSRATNMALARSMGFEGGFGGGEHNAWLGADPNRNTTFGAARGALGALSQMFPQQGGGYGMSGFAPMQGGWGGDGWSTGMMQPNITNNYSNTYQQQPFDYGFGNMFGGGGYGGYGGYGDMGFGGYGSFGGGGYGQPSAGSLMFKHGGRVGKRKSGPMKFASGGSVPGYASGGIPMSAIQTPVWIREFQRATGTHPYDLGITDPVIAMRYIQGEMPPRAPHQTKAFAPDPYADPPAQRSQFQPELGMTMAGDVPGYDAGPRVGGDMPGGPAYSGSPDFRPRPMMRRARQRPAAAAAAPQSGFAPLTGPDPVQDMLTQSAPASPEGQPYLMSSAYGPGPDPVQDIATRGAQESPLARLVKLLGLDREIGPMHGAWQGDQGPSLAVTGYDNRRDGGRVRYARGGRIPGALAALG